eukprot:1399586-Amphidinium_carterae.1
MAPKKRGKGDASTPNKKRRVTAAEAREGSEAQQPHGQVGETVHAEAAAEAAPSAEKNITPPESTGETGVANSVDGTLPAGKAAVGDGQQQDESSSEADVSDVESVAAESSSSSDSSSSDSESESSSSSESAPSEVADEEEEAAAEAEAEEEPAIDIAALLKSVYLRRSDVLWFIDNLPAEEAKILLERSFVRIVLES